MMSEFRNEYFGHVNKKNCFSCFFPDAGLETQEINETQSDEPKQAHGTGADGTQGQDDTEVICLHLGRCSACDANICV